MAQIQRHPLPPTPPLPVYSPPLQRSQSPQIEITHEHSYNLNAAAFRQNHILASGSAARPSVARVASGIGSNTPGDGIHTSLADDNIFTDEPLRAVRPMTPQQSQFQDPSRLSPSPQVLPRRKPLDEGSRLTADSSHRRIVSENWQTSQSGDDGDFQKKAMRHASASAVETDSQSEGFEPLQYHHQILEDAETKALDKRASKLTINTANSGESGSSDPNARMSHYGRVLQRPDSGFSSTSDFRGRTGSPRLSPIRPVTRQVSRSPDTRPLSYVDLLNVPYPQPAPSGADMLVNAQLRDSIGSNAALLSTRKTLEMYRANAKKTTDLAMQYEFAIFMISAAQEEGLELDNVSDSAESQKSNASIRDDLLKEAKHLLQKLADRSYPFAQYYLADGYASGLFNKGKEDWERAFPLFLAASKHGHAEAGYRAALCYEFGWGCRVDGMKAVQFYQQAASKNHPGAMLRLGRACLTGDMGLTKRYREGVRWLKRAAESADFQYNQAPYDLGLLHETGFGPDVFKDESYAAQLFTKAADLGHVEANYRLGEAYEYGQLNCPKDPALSIHFYTGAAERGHVLSQMALCAWYMVGVERVLEKDESEAYEWARKAAEGGLPKAQYTVGYFTEMGIGCRRDPLEANVWYVRAADQGEERAKHRMAAIRAAATGADPVTAAAGKKGVLAPSDSSGNIGAPDSEKKKRFGIF